MVRFKDMFNVKIKTMGDTLIAKYESSEKIKGTRKIQVVPELANIHIRVLQPDGNVTQGYGESNLRSLKPGTSVQFERYGYVKLRDISDSEIYGYFTN